MEVWHVWMIIALLLVVVEVFTSGFAVLCFSIGAVVAAIVSVTDCELKWQVLVFAVFSALAFVLVRPLLLKAFAKSKKAEAKSGVEALIGRTATVTETIDGSRNQGRVAVDGDDWKAVTDDGSMVAVGEKVEILQVDSIVLTVKKKITE